MNGIDKIKEKILSEAKTAEAAALADAKKKAEEILAAGEREAEEIRERIGDRAAREGENIISRAKSAAAMTRRSTELAVRGRLIDEVFEEAFAQIRALPAEEYRALLVKLLSRALIEQLACEAESRALHGDEVAVVEAYEVVLNEVDRRTIGEELVAETRRALTGRVAPAELAKLRLSGKSARISGGAILRYGDIESNCSFEAVFAQTREEREAEVGHMLFV